MQCTSSTFMSTCHKVALSDLIKFSVYGEIDKLRVFFFAKKKAALNIIYVVPLQVYLEVLRALE